MTGILPLTIITTQIIFRWLFTVAKVMFTKGPPKLLYFVILLSLHSVFLKKIWCISFKLIDHFQYQKNKGRDDTFSLKAKLVHECHIQYASVQLTVFCLVVSGILSHNIHIINTGQRKAIIRWPLVRFPWFHQLSQQQTYSKQENFRMLINLQLQPLEESHLIDPQP